MSDFKTLNLKKERKKEENLNIGGMPMEREDIIKSDCKVYIFLSTSLKLKEKRCWSKENQGFDHWVELHSKFWANNTLQNEVMNIGFITIMQTLYIEWINEFPRKKIRERINEYWFLK